MPAAFRALVDDAAVFPPGNVPLDEAAVAHARHRQAPYADLVGPFVVGDAALPELAGTTGLAMSVVVSGGAGALAPAVAWADRVGVTLAGVEVALRDSATGELAHNARRVVTAVDQLVAGGDLDDEVPVFVEMPRLYGAPPTPDWLAALDELAAMDHRLKLRTGGHDWRIHHRQQLLRGVGVHELLRQGHCSGDRSTGLTHHPGQRVDVVIVGVGCAEHHH